MLNNSLIDNFLDLQNWQKVWKFEISNLSFPLKISNIFNLYINSNCKYLLISNFDFKVTFRLSK